MDDWDIRVKWAEYAALKHGWPYSGVPLNDPVTGRFLTDWHEQEYQTYKAGFMAMHKAAKKA